MFADDVATCLLEAYDQLPKQGKPQGKEWTVLAGLIVAWSDDQDVNASGAATIETDDCSSRRLEVLALATGNRCVGQSRMSAKGCVVNDCHAEVLVRRCLKRVIYSDLERALDHSPTSGITSSSPSVTLRILEQPVDVESANKKDGSLCVSPRARLRLHRNASLHLCITETPCGDASIYETPGSFSRFSKTWTGAKPASSRSAAASKKGTPPSSSSAASTFDSSDERHQHEGCLRTKSARSDTLAANRTLSMSCSDKIAMWGLIGLEGSLLSHFVEPIRLATVTLMLGHKRGNAAHAVAATSRALRGRFVASIMSADLPGGVHVGPPPTVLCSSAVGFQRSRSAVERREHGRMQIPTASGLAGIRGQHHAKRRKLGPGKRVKLSTPCGFALCSTCDNVMKNEVLISARGIPQGTTLKSMTRSKNTSTSAKPSSSGLSSFSSLCKANLFASFLDIAAKWGGAFEVVGSVLKYKEKTLGAGAAHTIEVVLYQEAKRLNSTYRVAKEHVLAHELLEHWLTADVAAYEAFEAPCI